MTASYTLQPFEAAHLDAAARLLAEQHRRARRSVPALPARFEAFGAARQAVDAAWQRPWTSGVAALSGDTLRGYLFGHARFDQLMGRTVWVGMAGHALAADISPTFYGELYAAAAPAWLEWGCFDHYILTATGDAAALDAWYGLEFGRQQAYGLRAITAADNTAGDATAPLVIRRATPADKDALAAAALWIAEYQARAPVWAPIPAEEIAQRPASYASVLDDADAMVWLAVANDRLLGFQIYFPAEATADALHVPSRCAELSVAATHPDARGRGVGQALCRVAFQHLHRQAYTHCLTDWRTTNLAAARFWPRQGFQPTAYRLHRRIDARALWAHP